MVTVKKGRLWLGLPGTEESVDEVGDHESVVAIIFSPLPKT